MDLEDGETDDESSIAIDLSHLSVNVSIVNSTFSDCGETTLSANDTLIERLELEDAQGDASYQVDQVSIDFDDSEIVVYIDEDSLSSGDEAIKPGSTKNLVSTVQKDFSEDHEIFKLDAKVNENKDAMTSLQSEENEGSNIKPVDSRLDGINDCTEIVSKALPEVDYNNTEERAEFAGIASVEPSQHVDSEIEVDRATLDKRSAKPNDVDDNKTDLETSQAQGRQPEASVEQLLENQVNSNKQDSPPNRTSHRPRDVVKSENVFGNPILEVVSFAENN